MITELIFIASTAVSQQYLDLATEYRQASLMQEQGQTVYQCSDALWKSLSLVDSTCPEYTKVLKDKMKALEPEIDASTFRKGKFIMAGW